MKGTAFLLTLLVLWPTQLHVPAQNSVRGDADCQHRLRLSRTEENNPAVPASSPTYAIPAAETAAQDIIRVDTELVVAEFDVRDKKGNRILGLGATDIRLEEDGVEQRIEVFAFGKASARIGRSIILIIDHSQSQRPYIETSIEAAKVLVDTLEPSDRMALVTDDVVLLTDFTSDKSLLKSKLESLKTRALGGHFGRSRQLTALHAAVTELFEMGDKRPVVILQTDGDQYPEFALWNGRGDRYGRCPGSARRFSDLKKMLEKAGTTVHTVIPGVRIERFSDTQFTAKASAALEQRLSEEKQRLATVFSGSNKVSRRLLKAWGQARLRDAEAIERLSLMTGGISQYLEGPEQAGEVYNRILSEMNQRYLVGYYPLNTRDDGEKRTIRIRLRDRTDAEISGRSSYTPSRPKVARAPK